MTKKHTRKAKYARKSNKDFIAFSSHHGRKLGIEQKRQNTVDTEMSQERKLDNSQETQS